MTKPNFLTMSRKELRAYVLAHRDDDQAFYAYADKIYEAEAAVELAVFEWLKAQNPDQAITKVQEKSFDIVMTDTDGSKMEVKIQLMMSYIPYRPFIEDILERPVRDNNVEFGSYMMVFVSKNETSAFELDRELTEANFHTRTKFSLVVGYLDSGGKFHNI